MRRRSSAAWPPLIQARFRLVEPHGRWCSASGYRASPPAGWGSHRRRHGRCPGCGQQRLVRRPAPQRAAPLAVPVPKSTPGPSDRRAHRFCWCRAICLLAPMAAHSPPPAAGYGPRARNIYRGRLTRFSQRPDGSVATPATAPGWQPSAGRVPRHVVVDREPHSGGDQVARAGAAAGQAARAAT